MQATATPPTPLEEAEAPGDFSTEGYNLARILAEQGRTYEWLRKQPGILEGFGPHNPISRTYMYRLRLADVHPYASAVPPGFWRGVARVLGVKPAELTRPKPGG